MGSREPQMYEVTVKNKVNIICNGDAKTWSAATLVVAILSIPLTIVTFQQKFHWACENGDPLVTTFAVALFLLFKDGFDREIPFVAFGGVRPCKERTVVTLSKVDDNEYTKPIMTVATIFKIYQKKRKKVSGRMSFSCGVSVADGTYIGSTTNRWRQW